jgi:hypothetical protein
MAELRRQKGMSALPTTPTGGDWSRWRRSSYNRPLAPGVKGAVGGPWLTGSQSLPREKKGSDDMRTKQYWQRKAEEALRALQRLEVYGDDTFTVDTVLSWTKHFNPAGPGYTYAAVKLADGRWATTSQAGSLPHLASWEDLTAHWASGQVTDPGDIWQAAKWRTIEVVDADEEDEDDA